MKSLTHSGALVLAIAAMGFGGCSESDQNEISSKLQEASTQAKSAADSVGSAATQAMDSVKQKYAGEFKTYEDNIAKMKANAETLADERLSSFITAAEKSLNEAKAKLASIKPDQASIDTIKGDLEQLMVDFGAAYQMAVDRLKEFKP